MSGAESLLPPETYSTWVPVVGGVLLLAVAAWYAFVLLSTRRPARPREPGPLSPDGRARFEEDVEAALAAYRSGERDLRALHLDLARIMRAFASERIGRDVRSWTAGEIADHDPTAQLGDLLRLWEEPSFARRSDAEADTAVQRAREVIRRW
ncbi:cytochrome c-type biogenesis protein [Georgenia satyanarayanai]|uniref:hypothetical protein n=1 Tax=Georgenia satyanarayanai TaxID=860221 RepID=UPI0012652EB6|nr:hypothetical protein [Georgenia satyanarayanai]